MTRQLVALMLLAAIACGDAPLEPPPSPLDACAPIFGFAKAQTTAYYLTTIDGAAPPKTISLPQGAFTVRTGQLELHDAGTEYLWAFYAGSGPLAGASTVLGQFARPREDGRIDLLVGSEPTQIRGIASVDGTGAARVVTEDQPALGMNNMGAHDFLFARCP